MGRSEMFKKFLCQKTVLDTLRVYLDITKPFLQDLLQIHVIDKDDLHLLNTLDWPSNRNHLMQMLIKRPWNRDEFNLFVNLLEKTQDPDLVKTIKKKAEDYFKDSGIQIGDAKEIKIDPQVSMLDDLLMGMSVRDQNKIRSLLKQKDEKIKKLEEENVQLETRIQELTADNTDLHLRLHSLENSARDVVYSIEFEQEPGALEQGLSMVKVELSKRQDRISDFVKKLDMKTKQYLDQKEWTSELTTEVIKLKDNKEKLEKELQELNQKYHMEVFDYNTKIEENQAVMTKQENKIAAQEKYYETEIEDRDDEIEHLKREIGVSEKMKQAAETAKEETEERFLTLQEKVRKLLTSLGLENECKNLDLSVDFARDVSITKRKMSKVTSKPTLEPIAPLPQIQSVRTEEELFEKVDLPWGNTPQDIQRRRESVSIEQMFPPSIPASISIEFDGSATVGSKGLSAGLLPRGNFSPRKRLPPLGER